MNDKYTFLREAQQSKQTVDVIVLNDNNKGWDVVCKDHPELVGFIPKNQLIFF